MSGDGAPGGPDRPVDLGPGRPTPVADVAGGAATARVRFAAGGAVPDAVVARLAGVCAAVDTDDEACAEAGRDWWPLTVGWARNGEIPARAGAVARPGDADQVAQVLAVCNEARVPVTTAAGRSGVCGASIPVHGGVVLDMTGLAGIAGIDITSLVVDVLPGTFGDRFENDLRRSSGLTSGHWPQSMALSTVGGWLACRSAGQYSTRYGKIEDMVVGLDVALADGRRVRTGSMAPRSATGPDLNQVFVGSEGTLGVITGARLRVHRVPTGERRSAWAWASWEAGLDACRRILQRAATPAVLRLYDHVESKRHFGLDDTCALIVLDEGDPGLVDAVAAVVDQECSRPAAAGGADRLDDALVEHWLSGRNHVTSLASLADAGIVADTVEVAASWAALPGLTAACLDAARAVPGTLAASVHQSHAYGDGACLYFTFAGRPADVALDPDDYYRRTWDAVMAATVAAGGAVSHHHGIGLNRARHLTADPLGPHDVLVAVKAALDPAGILNPGKLGLPSPWGPPVWP